MLVTVNAYRPYQLKPMVFSIDLNLEEDFNPHMDADAVRETLDIIICQDADVTDIDEEDLYTEAERVYQALQKGRSEGT